MRKKLLALTLALCMVLPGLPSTVRAAHAGGSMDGFTAVRAYDGRFADVPSGAWYYSDVTTLYEMGLTDGQSAKSFGAQDQVSLAEVLSFAARIHSTYFLGSAQTGPDRCAQPGGPWYAPYVGYLKVSGVIDDRFEGLYTQPATRGQVAYVLGRILPEEELEPLNADVVLTAHNSGRYVPDVTGSTTYKAEILDLYRWGIVTGTDAKGSYLPASTITRGELAAMLARMVDPSLRVAIDWDLTALYSAEGATYPGLIKGRAVLVTTHGADDQETIASNVRYMLKNGITQLKIHITSGRVTDRDVDRVMERYLDESMRYVEQGYNNIQYSYNYSGDVTLVLQDPNCSSSQREEALARAIAVHDQFWADGTLCLGMAQRDIARTYFDYLCRTCEYDYTYSSSSRTAYGALCTGKAVCQGYTAAYDLFLKLEGIDCTSVGTDAHIWTAAVLDGTLYHIDPTWGDASWGTDESQFCMEPERAWNRSGIGA